MFEFIMDIGNYENRLVDRSEFGWGFVSTCRVSDGSQPFETAIKSSEYARADNPEDTDKMVIVEAYGDADAAQEGHNRWVNTMTKSAPDGLTDCCNAGIAKFLSECGADFTEIRVPDKKVTT